VEIGAPGPLGRLLIRGEVGHDIIDELRPVAGEPVIDKASYGAFCGTNLEALLRQRGVDTLAIAGVTADVCVHTTLREATDRWFHCHYVADAISAFDPEIRRVCEKMVLEEGGVWGELTTVDETIARFSSTPAPG
jgi:nicotinamidase-related amidase